MERWIVAFPLTQAFLCVNCECVGNKGDQCPVCEGQQLIQVAPILNRTTARSLCRTCDAVIPQGNHFCSDECERLYSKETSR